MAEGPRRYLVAMPWGRVGSTLLATILVRSLRDEPHRTANELLTTHPAWSADEQISALEAHYELAGPGSPAAFIGTKESALAMRDPARVTDLCARAGIRVVRMRRANLVKAAVSQIRAEAHAATTGDWTVPVGQDVPGPMVIDPSLLLQRIRTMEAADVCLASMFRGCHVLEVEYEELLADLEGTVRRVRAHLGIPQRSVEVPHRKATPDDLATAIVNHDQVARALRGTPWADLLGAGGHAA